MVKKVICDLCEKKCILDINKWDNFLEVQGNLCSEGIKHAEKEINNKNAILTTIIKVKGGNHNVVPVKSNKPINKNIWVECSKALSRLYVGVPIKVGEIVCQNILNTGVDIVCTKTIIKD